MYDYKIICFNGANRTIDRETTDATAIHPISKKCEIFLAKYCRENKINNIGGIAIMKGLATSLFNILEEKGFQEAGTFFTDEITNGQYTQN